MNDYEETAKKSRIKCLELVYKAQTSHIGSLFSCADIMAVLFEKIDLRNDKFVLSAGWKACMLYYHLWRKRKITNEELNSYCQPGSKFIGLTEPIIPEILFSGGSMGMGLPAAVGFALAKKFKQEEGKVYVIMSDGEMAIGTTWESALIAAHHNLDNLVVILDNNGFQAMGKTEDILYVPPYFETQRIDGHDYLQISDALNMGGWIYADTIKGKGVSFMEGNNDWHYRTVDKESYELALKELGQ